MSPFEIMRTVRSAGFDPLSPPLREGTIYVLRATDYRGIPMRVVLDARTGAIRNATPTVAQAAYGMPYASRPYATAPPYGAPYGAPAGYDVSGPRAVPLDGSAPPPSQPAALTAIGRTPTAAQPSLPLPRPRPAVLASKTPGGAEPSGLPKAASTDDGAGKAQSAAAPKQTPVGANQTAAGAGSSATAPAKPAPVPPLTINN